VKISFKHDELKKALTLLCNVIPKQPRTPILSHVKIEVANKQYAVLCSNNESVFLYRKIPLEACEALGGCTVHGKNFLELVKNFNNKTPIKVQMVSDNKLKVSQSRSRYTFKTLNHFEYPEIKIPNTNNFHLIPAPSLLKSLKIAESVTGNDMSKSILQSVMIEPTPVEGYIRTVATDGVRLLVCKIPGILKNSIIIAKESVSLLVKVLHDSKECSIHSDEANVFIKTENGFFCSRMLEKKFPDYKRLFSKGSHIDIKIDLDPVRSALKRALLFSEKVIITLHPNGKMNISSTSPVEEGEEEVYLEKKVDKLNEPIKIAVNAALFSHVLEKFEGEELSMKYYAPLSPLALLGSPDLVGLFMPLKV